MKRIIVSLAWICFIVMLSACGGDGTHAEAYGEDTLPHVPEATPTAPPVPYVSPETLPHIPETTPTIPLAPYVPAENLPYVPETMPSAPPVTYVPVEIEPSYIPSWEHALEAFLLEFLPIFTPVTVEPRSHWSTGGYRQFVREHRESGMLTNRHIADPVTGEIIDADTVPYYVTHHFYSEDGSTTSATRIASDFFLYDIVGDGVPILLIRWPMLDAPFGDRSMFRYIDGSYVPVRVSIRTFWWDDVIDTPFILDGWGEFFAKDSEGRTIILGAGGAGGFGVWAHEVHMDDIIRLEPMFFLRYETPAYGPILRVYYDAAIVIESWPKMEPEDIYAIPWLSWLWDLPLPEWEAGEADMTPLPLVPIMPGVTVVPVPRMTEAEQRLTERITARLLTEERILQ